MDLTLWTEFNGETKYTQTDLPGTKGDLATSKEMRVQKFNKTWTAILPNYPDTCPWPLSYNKSALVTDSFGVDTNPNDNRPDSLLATRFWKGIS